MSQSICILGRQPTLGLAELESLFGSKDVSPFGAQAAIINIESDGIPLSRLGGTLKTCKLLIELPYTNWTQLIDYITGALPIYLPFVPAGKIRFGLSTYGLSVKVDQINRAGLSIKKIIRDSGRSVRVIPNKETALSTAQTIHNQLIGLTGMELALMTHGDKTILAQVVNVQDITAYANRDQNRPKRDARVGMLPPKLAQIMINLAVGQTDNNSVQEQTISPAKPSTLNVLDPFCGTGVILQEAMLMGYDVVGSDIDSRMQEYTQINIDWLRQNHPKLIGLSAVQAADATSHQWPTNIHTLASEMYLGRPFASMPSPDTLKQVSRDVDTITKKFLRNLASQVKSGFRLCIAVPAWKTKNGFHHLPCLDHLEELGYTRISFVHAQTEDLIYYRPGQIVARELVVMIRK